LGALRPELERPSESPDDLLLVDFLDVVSLDVVSLDVSSDGDLFADVFFAGDFFDVVLALLFFAGLARLVDFLVLDDREVFLAITAPFWGGLVQPSVAPRARPPT
jgi:hypothetical protein